MSAQRAPHMGFIKRPRMAFQDEFVTLRNAWTRDGRLSWRARGILGFLMSHEDGFTTSVAQLTHEATEGRDATRKAVQELETAGYLHRRRRSDGTRFWVEWELLDPFASGPVPVDNLPSERLETRRLETRRSDLRTTGNPSTGNPSDKENKTKKELTTRGNHRADEVEPVDSSTTNVVQLHKPGECQHCHAPIGDPFEEAIELHLCGTCYADTRARRAAIIDRLEAARR